MRLVRFDSPAEFRDHTEPFLEAREAEHNLLLGLASVLVSDPGRYPEPPYLASVDEGSDVVAVALRTPPHNLVLSMTAHPEALELIARDAQDTFGSLPGVSGPSDEARRFADLWRSLTGQGHELRMAERIYQLERVEPVRGVPGRLRDAAEADRELLVRWFEAFGREALGKGDAWDAKDAVEARLRGTSSGLVLWDDDGPVSLAGYGGPTPHGIRIGPVYTPPELRGRGYASACVAELSQRLLDQGRRYCFLFTDLANPTSNAIYQRIGYRPVCDVEVMNFTPAQASTRP